MREKSQIEDMRAALRGDIERARARREADPWRTAEPTTSEEQTPEESVPADAPDPEVEAGTAPEPLPDPEPGAQVAEEAPEPAMLPEEEPEPEPVKKGFFARLFGRG